MAKKKKFGKKWPKKRPTPPKNWQTKKKYQKISLAKKKAKKSWQKKKKELQTVNRFSYLLFYSCRLDSAVDLMSLHVGDRILEVNGRPVEDHCIEEIETLIACSDDVLQVSCDYFLFIYLFFCEFPTFNRHCLK